MFAVRMNLRLRFDGIQNLSEILISIENNHRYFVITPENYSLKVDRLPL